ncbi:hypothetical protein BK133_18065 [Paenibacillus sp. FSL H8-0548]|uniref:hypothetical protein n=1 Tax=Paenibacillus sp. FSL H8-0548 TaxID=1920422 RepID=UPI00096D3129|nr:hypothetical protein [Paenibacillus sp. FSL H8-0548]OMF29053.1 hypothetical protein BK133_18065 [Paenibacillus sp. FSL H8-0548]
MKKVQKIAVILLAVIIVVIAGCSSAKPPKEALQAAMTKITEADSYAVKMSLGLDELEIPQDAAMQGDLAATAAIVGMIKDATITVDAVYQKEPMRTDLNMNIVIPGDMEMKLTVPMIFTDQILYIKVPQIPMLPLPETITGKYIKIDLKELAEQQGAAGLDLTTQQKLGQEIGEVLLKNFDEKTYFSELKASEAGLPADLKADQVVAFEINEGNYPQTVETVVNEVLPAVLDILLKNEASLQSLQLEKADIEQLKTDLETNKEEILNTLKNDIKVNTLKFTGAISDGYLSYQAGKLNFEASDEASGQKMKLGLHYDVIYSDIGKEPKFEEIPTDVITIDELTQMFQLPTGL